MSDFEVYEESMDFIKDEAEEKVFAIIDIDDDSKNFLKPNKSTEQVMTMIDYVDLTPEAATPVVNIIDTLKSSMAGVALMTHYKKFKDLEEEHRLHITDIIVEREMRSSQDLSIKPERLDQLADLIIEVFPTEDKETYYTPYRFDSGSKKKISAKGKLYNKLLFYRSLLINSGVVRRDNRGKKRKSQADDSAPARLAFRHDLIVDCSLEEYRRDTDWLQKNVEPWEQVKSLWAKTSRMRIRNLIVDNSDDDYFKRYPILMNVSKGLELMDIDFSTLYPERTSNLTKNYRLLEKRIVEYANKLKRKTDDVRFLLKNIETVSDRQLDENNIAELKVLYVLKLLAYLCPCPPIISPINATDSSWRANKESVQSEFILHVQSYSELNERLDRRKEKFAKYALKDLPLLIVIGNEKIDALYIRICQINYQVPSIIRGLDAIFKSFYALQLEFPKVALFPWSVIQHLVFQIQGEADIVYPSVWSLISDLRKIT